MSFREVSVIEARNVLRLWLAGDRGERPIAAVTGLDRKTVRRYIAAGVACGLVRGAGEAQLSDELIGQVVGLVRPDRPRGHGAAWEVCEAQRAQLKEWLGKDLTVKKAHELLGRRGVVVPYRTLHRFCAEELGYRRKKPTVRVADCDPGQELQIDFGKMGLLADAGRRRVVWALIFTAVFSRHMFVWLSFRQTIADVIAGCEAAWTFFDGVFAVVIPDNMGAIVDEADPTDPRINVTFGEYAQDRGFVIDPCRVRTPTDKPRVERAVRYVRGSLWAGEEFTDLAHAQRHSEDWCREVAGRRIHGTTQTRPAELFAVAEAPALLPAPVLPYDVPLWQDAKVHRDHHIQAAKALYSIPGALIGQTVTVRIDRQLVKVVHRGQVIKVHPRQPPGGRSTDPDDLPDPAVAAYALRDLDALISRAGRYGPAVGDYAQQLLQVPLPWTRMRTVYRLLGLVKRYGPDRVQAACARALDCEAVDVGLISRMLERATETDRAAAAVTAPATAGGPPEQLTLEGARFARDPAEFAVTRTPGEEAS